MNNRWLKTAFVVVMVGSFVGCADQPARRIAPLVLDYAQLGTMQLAVNKLNFVQTNPLNSTNDPLLSHFKPQLADAAYRWGVDRLQANGQQGQATFYITNATITRQKLTTRDDMGGWFTRKQSEKWVGQLSADLLVKDSNGFNGTASGSVTRSTTIPEEASAGEQENAYRRLLLGLMDDFNQQMVASMRDHLQPVLGTMP
jgi:hypothetical protein